MLLTWDLRIHLLSTSSLHCLEGQTDKWCPLTFTHQTCSENLLCARKLARHRYKEHKHEENSHFPKTISLCQITDTICYKGMKWVLLEHYLWCAIGSSIGRKVSQSARRFHTRDHNYEAIARGWINNSVTEEWRLGTSEAINHKTEDAHKKET